MAGFGPVGSAPVASFGSVTTLPGYTITSAHVNYGHVTPAVTMVISGPRATWIGAEVLHTGAAQARLTTIAAEVLHTGAAQARATWVGVEVLRSLATQNMPTAAHLVFRGVTPVVAMVIAQPRVTWVGAEVLHTGAAKARASWMGAEVLHTGAAKARASWVGVEVLRSVKIAVSGGGSVSIIWG